MRNFRQQGRGGFGGRGRGFGNDRGFSRDRNSERQMFDVTCTKCGKAAQVPFKPTGNKPVLCSDCFRQDEGRGSRNDSGSNNSAQLEQINAKLDKIIMILKELELDVDEDAAYENEEQEEEENGI